MNKYIILFFILLFISNLKIVENIEPVKQIDFYKQNLKYKESNKNWVRAHSGMKNMLKKWAYTTFDGAYKIAPKYVYKPKSIKDIVEIIKKHTGEKIKASGGHHTFNDIGITNNVIIKTYNLNKILKLDKKNKLVTVQSGMLLEDLNIYLEKNNLSFPILPAIPYQSIGGALATSSHGSNLNIGSMASFIKSIVIVSGDGKVHKLSKKDGDLFRAAVTNIGAIGVVYSVTLKCEDLFVVDHKKEFMTIKQFVDSSDKLLKKYDYLQAYLFPFKKGKSEARVYLRDKVINWKNNKSKIKVADRNKNIKKLDKKYDYGHYVLTKNFEASYYTETEIAVDFSIWKKALFAIINLFKNNKYKYKTSYPILVRFTGPDDSLIGMTSGRPSVYFDIFDKVENKCKNNLKQFYLAFYKLLVNEFNGRPHYGKRHCLNKKDMIKLYGKNNIHKFNNVRKLMDPYNMFANNYVNRLLVNNGKNVCTFGC